MFRLVRRILGPRMLLAMVGLAVTLAWQGWMLVRPRAIPLDSRRRALAVEAAVKLARAMPEPATRKPTLAVARFEHDSTGEVTEEVRLAIDRMDVYAVQPTTVMQNVRRELSMKEEAPDLDAIATADLSGIDAEYLLAGRVSALRAAGGQEEALLEAVLMPISRPSESVRLSAGAGGDADESTPRAAVQSYPWPARLLSWLALAALLPLAFGPMTRRGLEKESNLVNLGMLAGLTTVAAVAAYAMVGFQVRTIGAALWIAGATVLALVYNWGVLGKMEAMRY